jgi:hypothetical protein
MTDRRKCPIRSRTMTRCRIPIRNKTARANCAFYAGSTVTVDRLKTDSDHGILLPDKRRFYMAIQSESIQDIYTRKVGGETYQYDAQYIPGKRVVWNARVYRDGDLKGTPNGVLIDNELTGDVLRQSIVTLVECTIEAALGIEE